MHETPDLPIKKALPAVRSALAAGNVAVLIAPPGAGKTTVTPLALLDEPWMDGRKLLMLEPRRLAARAAAARMASTLNEAVGATVGYRVRLQSSVSARTRIEVVTEGVFTRMLLADPGLDGVGAVLFDEFHERSLDADLGLALARDAQLVLRSDLRLLIMSATLDGARIAQRLGDAPLIESHGRMFPVETIHLSPTAAEPLEVAVERAVMTALGRHPGDVLVFLPGQGEIRRCAARLDGRLDDLAGGASVLVAPLFGAMDPREQDIAIAPAPSGWRKVVLATSIAETSLTIPGVRVVIDSGFARIPRFDPAAGLTRLDTVRVSRAAADQRRGRAGRLGPGVCYRLWPEPETRALAPYARPEILESDLSGLALDLAVWGAKDPEKLAFLDPPPAAALAEARALLVRIGALDTDLNLTRHGRAVATLPLAPRLAHMVLRGAAAGAAETAARIAAIVSERGLGGAEVDLRGRLDRFATDRSAAAARELAGRWARAAMSGGLTSDADGGARDVGLLLAEAYPERIAKARGRLGEFRLASGRGVFLDPTDPLARETWLAVGELGGGAARDRVLLAAPLNESALSSAFSGRVETQTRVGLDARGRVRGVRLRRLGALVLEERPLEHLPQPVIEAALTQEVLTRGPKALPWAERASSMRSRLQFLHGHDPQWPDVSDAALIGSIEAWLAPLLAGRESLADVDDAALTEALAGLVGHERRRLIDTLAPERFVAPTGSRLQIDYAAEGGPRVDVRVQELFGLIEHPAVFAGRVPLTLALLSPAHRSIQTTRDLPGFWRGSWSAVRKEMRGRYPKHPWPEDASVAAPTTRAKPRPVNS